MGRPLPGIEAASSSTWKPRASRRTCASIEQPDVEGELALRAGWPSMFRGYLDNEARYRKCFAGELVPHRRPRAARRRRLLLVRRPRRRRHQVGRPPDRTLRGRERADGAPGGRRGRRDRQARPGGRRGGQGLRVAEGRLRAEPSRCALDLLGARAQAARRGGGAQGDRLPADAAAHPQRQDHAPPAEGPRARPARRRPVDAGGQAA